MQASFFNFKQNFSHGNGQEMKNISCFIKQSYLQATLQWIRFDLLNHQSSW